MSEQNNYNVKRNPPHPSKDEIKGKMDFNKTYEAYTHKAYRSSRARFDRHSFKNRKTMLYIILAIVIGLLVFTEESENESNKNNDLNKPTILQQDTLKLTKPAK